MIRTKEITETVDRPEKNYPTDYFTLHGYMKKYTRLVQTSSTEFASQYTSTALLLCIVTLL